MSTFSNYMNNSNPLKRFFFKLFLLFIIIFLIDFSIGKTLAYFYFKQDSGQLFRTTYALEKTTEDILIFGSSRANHHYHPTVIEERLHLSYYNVGRDGNYLFYHYAILQGILKRYSPKLIVLDFMEEDFKASQDSYDRISSLLPYYKTHPEIQSTVLLKSPFERLKLISSIYPYNSSLFTIAVGNMEFNKGRNVEVKGYVPLTKKWNRSLQPISEVLPYELDSIKIKTFEAFLQDCNKSKVKVIVVASPYFKNSKQADYSIQKAIKIAEENNVMFFDYSRDPYFINNPGLFADIAHLNDDGAKIFTNKLLEDLQILEASKEP